MERFRRWLKRGGRIGTAVGAVWKGLDLISSLDWARQTAPSAARWIASRPFPDASVVLLIVGIVALIASYLLDRRNRQRAQGGSRLTAEGTVYKPEKPPLGHFEPGIDTKSLAGEGGNEELMHKILELLEANLELTKQQLQDRTTAPPNVIERAVSGLEAKGKISVRGNRVIRRETVYDDKGRVAGEEIVHESGRRDAAAFPETVHAGTNVGAQEVKGATLNVEPELSPPAISQGDRPGWRASCRSITGKPGHGALLLLKSTGERAAHFRCRLVRPDNSVADSPPSAFDEHERLQASGSVRYPVHFGDQPPLAEGDYIFHWLGIVEADRNEVLLASGSFKVNALGQVFCPPAPAQGNQQTDANEEPGPWLTASEDDAKGFRVRHRERVEEIELAITNLRPLSAFEHLYCEVEAPNETMRRIEVKPWSSSSANAFYPFEGSPPLMDGEYQVTWLFTSLASIIGGPASVKDYFRIEGGRLAE